MTPYYTDGSVAIYHGDCREVMRQLDGPADLVLADPPYGETECAWDVIVEGWIAEAARLLRSSGSLWCFGSMRMFLSQPTVFADWTLAQDIVWEKHNGSSFHADRFKRVHELALHFYRGAWGDVFKAPIKSAGGEAKQIHRKKRPPHMGRVEESFYETKQGGGQRLMRSVIPVRSCHGYAVHPTQKPTGIIAPLVEYSCPPSGLVLDPMMGSGTTLLVAKQTGRRAIGIDVDERWCEEAAKRLSQELPLANGGGQ